MECENSTENILSALMRSNFINRFFIYGIGIPNNLSRMIEIFRGHAQTYRLSEPDESKRHRRNILVLSSIVILAGVMGEGPSKIDFFGLKPSGIGDVRLFCLFIILIQLYWYTKRFFNVSDDGGIENLDQEGSMQSLNIQSSNHLTFFHKRSDLISNLLALILTMLSWVFLWLWSV